MALGKKLIQWSDNEIVAGMSTSADISDGGFSPETDAVNLIAEPGVMYAPASPTDKSTNVVGNIISSCPDPQFSGSHRVFVDDGGHYYTCNSVGDMTLAQTDGSGNTYAASFTHSVAYGGSTFTTSKEKIIRYSTSGPIFTTNFATFTTQNTVHPCIVFEDNVFYGDKNLLLRQTAEGSAPTVILTLSSEQNIVAIGIDPGSGRLLLSTTTQLNSSDTVPVTNKVHYYDGFSNKTLKTVLVDDMVTAFYCVGSNIYVTYSNNLGYWDGSGIQFLRKLKITYANFGPTTLPYRQHLTNVESTLYVIDGAQILAHGPVRQGGGKVFYYAYSNGVNGSLSHITNFGSGLLALAFPTNKFSTFSTSTPGSNQDLLLNSYEFDDEYWIRRCRIIYKNQVNNNFQPGSIRFLDQDGVVSTAGNGGLFLLINTSGAASAFKDILNINIKVKQLQPELIMGSGTPGIRRIIIYAEQANVTE